jgi:hypothetical protein
VPAVESFGSSASNVFCGAIGFAASTYIDYLSDPVTTVLLLVGALALIGLLIWKTRWRPTRPEPIRKRRGSGQILLTAGRIYGRHPLRYLVLGSIVLVLGFLSTGLAWLSSKLPAELTLRLSFDGLAVLLGTAAIALVLRNLDSGRQLGCFAAYRMVMRHFWGLLGAAVIAILVQLAIFLTIVGIPVAVYRIVRRVFVVNEVVLRRHSARSSQGASVELVRGNWWKTALIVLLLYFVTIWIGPVVGFVLLFQTRLSPDLINVIGSLVYTVAFPYAALAGALLYFDLDEQRRARAEPAAQFPGERSV